MLCWGAGDSESVLDEILAVPRLVAQALLCVSRALFVVLGAADERLVRHHLPGVCAAKKQYFSPSFRQAGVRSDGLRSLSMGIFVMYGVEKVGGNHILNMNGKGEKTCLW